MTQSDEGRTRSQKKKPRSTEERKAMLGPCDFQQAPEAETDENKEVPERRQKLLTTDSAQKSPCRWGSLSQGEKAGAHHHGWEGAHNRAPESPAKGCGRKAPDEPIRAITRFRAHGRASGLSGQVQSARPHPASLRAQRDVGCPARVPHVAPLNGDTLPTLEDRGPSQSREQADTSGVKRMLLLSVSSRAEAEQRTQKNAATPPGGWRHPRKQTALDSCSQHEKPGQGSPPPPLLSKQHGPGGSAGVWATSGPLNCENYQG